MSLPSSSASSSDQLPYSLALSGLPSSSLELPGTTQPLPSQTADLAAAPVGCAALELWDCSTHRQSALGCLLINFMAACAGDRRWHDQADMHGKMRGNWCAGRVKKERAVLPQGPIISEGGAPRPSLLAGPPGPCRRHGQWTCSSTVLTEIYMLGIEQSCGRN